MKLIDRYVAWNFAKNYLISFFVLVGSSIVLDMVFSFDDFATVNSRTDVTGMAALFNFAKVAGDYYFYQIFLFFVKLSPIIPVVAACFTLMRMTRFNELSALLSAGVPLLRVAMPILVVGLFLNGLLWVDQELLIPNMIPKLIRSRDYAIEADSRAFPIMALRDLQTGAKLFAGRYTPISNPPRMEYVSIIQLTADGQPVSHIKADRALWDQDHGVWRLQDYDPEKNSWGAARIDVNLQPDAPSPIETRPIGVYKGSLTPEQIQLARSAEFVQYLSTRRIDELLNSDLGYGRASLLGAKYSRGPAQIGLNLVLLMLAIAAVLRRDPQKTMPATLMCIVLCGTCWGLSFGGQMLAGSEPPEFARRIAEQWPALMAWLPIFIFGPMAIWLLDRVET